MENSGAATTMISAMAPSLPTDPMRMSRQQPSLTSLDAGDQLLSKISDSAQHAHTRLAELEMDSLFWPELWPFSLLQTLSDTRS